jgi:hypothetical protein
VPGEKPNGLLNDRVACSCSRALETEVEAHVGQAQLSAQRGFVAQRDVQAVLLLGHGNEGDRRAALPVRPDLVAQFSKVEAMLRQGDVILEIGRTEGLSLQLPEQPQEMSIIHQEPGGRANLHLRD